MSTNNSQDNPLKSVTDKIRSWFERTPQAQRAYEKISADLDTVVSKVESIVDENETLRDLRTKVGAVIDPPGARPDAEIPASDTPPSSPPAPTPPPAPSLEAGVTPGVPSTVVSPAPDAGTTFPPPVADVSPGTPVVDTTPPAPAAGTVPPTPSATKLPDPITSNPAASGPVTPENDVEVRRLPG